MPDRNASPTPTPTPRDPLVTRPDEPLPTAQDPQGPESRGYPADPKPDPGTGQGTDPHAGDLGHTV
jgi:hypothetical protein